MDEERTQKILQAITPRIQKSAHNLADLVAWFLLSLGIPPNIISGEDAMALGARLKMAMLEAVGVFHYIERKYKHAVAVAANADDPKAAAKAVKSMVVAELVCLELEHFTGRNLLLKDAGEGGGDTSSNAPDSFDLHSPEAKRWIAELDSPLQYLSVFQPPAINKTDEPRKADIASIKAKARISETEAGMLISKSAKAMANDRRAGRFPRRVYFQKCEGGKVLYNTREFLSYIENGIEKTERR